MILAVRGSKCVGMGVKRLAVKNIALESEMAANYAVERGIRSAVKRGAV